MMKKPGWYAVLLMFLLANGMYSNAQNFVNYPVSNEYDMREDLVPRRLTIAMWDYSWINGHYPEGPFEDFDKVTDELLERGFNTVRIDALPFVIHDLQCKGRSDYLVKKNPFRSWGLSTIDHIHEMPDELIEFMTITQKKGIYVILSSWGVDSGAYTTRDKFYEAWEFTLNVLKERDLLGHVLFVDLDQEFPNFSPFKTQIYSLDPGTPSETNPFDRMWNDRQLTFLRDHISDLLHMFQRQYPELRFTFSFVTNLDQFREMNLTALDVLEVHTWMDLKRFDARTGFFSLKKNGNPQNDYVDYMRRITATMQSMRPMLLQNMHNQLGFVRNWAREIGAPLVTTEALGALVAHGSSST